LRAKCQDKGQRGQQRHLTQRPAHAARARKRQRGRQDQRSPARLRFLGVAILGVQRRHRQGHQQQHADGVQDRPPRGRCGQRHQRPEPEQPQRRRRVQDQVARVAGRQAVVIHPLCKVAADAPESLEIVGNLVRGPGDRQGQRDACQRDKINDPPGARASQRDQRRQQDDGHAEIAQHAPRGVHAHLAPA
jgi:hypothetical protein